MTFLVDEDLPRSVALVIREFGHEAVDIRDIGLRGASDAQVATLAMLNRYCLVSGDGDFANVRQYLLQNITASSC
jgi:predicted nuclease of predicted toxin-antitoxin system